MGEISADSKCKRVKTQRLGRIHSLALRTCMSAIALVAVEATNAADVAFASLGNEFTSAVAPLIETHCLSCHDTETQEAKLDPDVTTQIQQLVASVISGRPIIVFFGRGVLPGALACGLLGNILLEDFDKELERRGLRFVRYTHDFLVSTKTKKSANRAFKSVERHLT